MRDVLVQVARYENHVGSAFHMMPGQAVAAAPCRVSGFIGEPTFGEHESVGRGEVCVVVSCKLDDHPLLGPGTQIGIYRAMDQPGVGLRNTQRERYLSISVAKSGPGQLPTRQSNPHSNRRIRSSCGLRIAKVTGRRRSMFAERVPESPRLARLLRYALRHFTFGRCFYTVLVVLLISSARMA